MLGALRSLDAHPLAPEINAERHALFMNEVGARMIVSVVAAFVLGLFFWGNISTNQKLLWFGFATFVATNSWLLIRNYRRQTPGDETSDTRHISYWHRVNLYLSVIWGILWSLAPIVFFPDATLVETFTVLLVMVILSSTPSVTMGCYPEIYITFLTPVFCSFGYHMWQLPIEGWLHVALVPFTWVSLVLYSLLIFKTQLNSIVLRLHLAQARDEADAANLAKTRMLAIASHDLRQNVQSATLYSNQLVGKVSAEHEPLVGRIQHVLLEGSRLLNHLLGIARTETQVLIVDPRRIALSVIADDMKNLFNAKAEAKGLALSIDLPAREIMTDPLLFRQILENLISNAIRYTDEGAVKVSGSLHGEHLEIWVKDSGRGISTENQATLFREYRTLSDHRESTGLGLFIVKRAADALGIRVSLDSEPGRGTTVRLSVPMSQNHRLHEVNNAV